jgi:hypothetical protein
MLGKVEEVQVHRCGFLDFKASPPPPPPPMYLYELCDCMTPPIFPFVWFNVALIKRVVGMGVNDYQFFNVIEKLLYFK